MVNIEFCRYMFQAPPNKNVNGSRLVRVLSDLSASEPGIPDIEISHKQFAQRLGLLVDLADSVTLSESLRGLHRIAYEATSISQTEVQQEFLKQRKAAIKAITRSFEVRPGLVPFKLPIPKADFTIEEASKFEPYQRFYTLHQSEIEFKTQKLRTNIRQQISGYSFGLAQLAELDQTLSKSMTLHTRKRFSVVPKLLKLRFEQLLKVHLQNVDVSEVEDHPVNWAKPGAWLSQFYEEMQQLLLAEVEIRMQPALGLVEAFNEEVMKQA